VGVVVGLAEPGEVEGQEVEVVVALEVAGVEVLLKGSTQERDHVPAPWSLGCRHRPWLEFYHNGPKRLTCSDAPGRVHCIKVLCMEDIDEESHYSPDAS